MFEGNQGLLLTDCHDEAPIIGDNLVDFPLGGIQFALDVVEVIFGAHGIIFVLFDVLVHFRFISGHGIFIFPQGRPWREHSRREAGIAADQIAFGERIPDRGGKDTQESDQKNDF